MFIVPSLGRNVKQYEEWLLLLAGGVMSAMALLPRRCHVCGAERLTRHGYYRRYAGSILIRIQRLLCVTCGRTHAVLPSFLAPYRPYEMPVVEQVYRLRLGGISWCQIGVLMSEIPLCVMQGCVRRARVRSGEVMKILSQGIRHLSPLWESECLLRSPEDGLAGVWDAGLTLVAAMKARHPDLELVPARLFEFTNVYLNSRGSTVWI